MKIVARINYSDRLLERGTSARALKVQRQKPLNQIILDMANSASLTQTVRYKHESSLSYVELLMN